MSRFEELSHLFLFIHRFSLLFYFCFNHAVNAKSGNRQHRYFKHRIKAPEINEDDIDDIIPPPRSWLCFVKKDAMLSFVRWLEDAMPSRVTIIPTPKEMMKFVIRNVLVFFFSRASADGRNKAETVRQKSFQ